MIINETEENASIIVKLCETYNFTPQEAILFRMYVVLSDLDIQVGQIERSIENIEEMIRNNQRLKGML